MRDEFYWCTSRCANGHTFSVSAQTTPDRFDEPGGYEIEEDSCPECGESFDVVRSEPEYPEYDHAEGQ